MLEIVGLILFLVLLPLVIPVRVGVRGTSGDEFEALGYVRILFGLIGFGVLFRDGFAWRIRLGPVVLIEREFGGADFDEDEGEEDEGDDEAEDEDEAEAESAASRSLREKLEPFLNNYARAERPIWKLAKRMLRTAWLRTFVVEGTFGAGAPDTTGKLAGMIQAARGVVGDRVHIDLRPDFFTTGFRGSFRVEIWFWLGFLVFALMVAAVSIGAKVAVWYLQAKLAGFRKPRPQAA